MFYIQERDGVTEAVEIEEGQEAPDGVEVFETVEALSAAMEKAGDEAFEREEDASGKALAEAEDQAARDDAKAGIEPPAAPLGLLIEACVKVLLHRGDMVGQLKEMGYDAHAQAVQDFADAHKIKARRR